MKKISLLSIALLVSTIAQTASAFDKAEVRSIVNALFSYNNQTEQQAKDEINGFVDELDVKFKTNDTYKKDVRDCALTIIDESVKWIGEKGYHKAYRLMLAKYSAHFAVPKTMSSDETAIYAAEMSREKEAVAKYITQRMKSRAESLVTRRRNDIKYGWRENGRFNVVQNTTDVVNLVKSTLRTYVGSQLLDRVEEEIKDALNQLCPICQEAGTTFPCQFFCGHWMHRACYNGWKASQFARHLDATCPYCRSAIEYFKPAITVVRVTPETFFNFSVNISGSDSDNTFRFNFNW